MTLARALASAGAGVDGEEGSQYFTGVLSDPHNAVYWTSSCAAVAMGMRHVAMSQFRAGECDACANELEAWCVNLGTTPITSEDDAKRVRATLQRAGRLVEAHTTALVDGYGNGPGLLGQSFKFQPHVGDTFVDSIIRAGVPFQISRFLTPMLRASSVAAGREHTVVLTREGDVYAWGDDGVGQLGGGERSSDAADAFARPTPAKVASFPRG